MSEVRGFEWFGHHRLLRKVIMSGKLVNKEPLVIGAGPDKPAFSPAHIVLLKVRRADGVVVPVIPGSSLKGLFRASCLMLLHSLGFEGLCLGVPPPGGLKEEIKYRYICLLGDEFKKLEEGEEEIPYGVAEEEMKLNRIVKGDVGMRGVCPLCLLFGATGLAAHISFADSYPVGSLSPGYEFKPGYRTCVAIDRRKGSSARRALFMVEYVEPGREWNFELRADNTPNYLLGLLMEVVELINAGLVKVGGMKSRGFGRVSISIDSVKVVSLDHEHYGISSERKLRKLDPIDVDVEWHGPLPEEGSWSVEAKCEDAKKVVKELVKAWRSRATELRKVYDGQRWRWEVAVGRGGS